MFAAAVTTLLCLAAPQQPTAATALTIHGRLLNGDMQPAADVAIGVLDAGDDDVPAVLAKPLTRSAHDGSFVVTVARKEPATERWLVVGGGTFATHMEELPATTEDLELGTVALAPGTTMVGRVRGADGAALAGARILASDMLSTTRHLSDQCEGEHLRCRTLARSDAHGVFKLPGMMLSAAMLRISHDGYFDESRQPVAIGDPLDVTLQVSPSVTGVVVDAEDHPVPAATVQAGTARAVTDTDGKFSISLRRRSDTQLTASKMIAGVRHLYSAEAKGDDTLRLRPATNAGATPTRAVRIQASDADGKPVPRFHAFVSWNPPNQLQYRPDALLLANVKSWDQEWTASAVDGIATASGPTNARDTAALIYVLADGHALGRVETDDKVLDGEPVVVTLAPEAVILGRVVDATTGAPIAGAEIIPTQRLTNDERGHYHSGFRDVASLLGAPTNVKSGANGRYELRALPAGALDLFVSAPGRISLPAMQLDLKAGETRKDIDWSVPGNVGLHAVLANPIPPGLDVRVHWERPNMWSSGWNSEFDHATHVAADGSFAFPDLHPKPYQLQALLPAPPRGGHRVKQTLVVWDGARADQEQRPLGPLGVFTFQGKVGGPVPWQRLAVAALTEPDTHSSPDGVSIAGPFALLASDRTFRLLASTDTRHLLLFDVVTGICLEWLSFDTAPQSPAFEGRAESIAVQLVPGSEAAQRCQCTLSYEPDEDHRPKFLSNGFTANANTFRSYTTAFAGDTVTMWLPSRSGTITIGNHGDPGQLDAGQIDPATPVPVRVGD